MNFRDVELLSAYLDGQLSPSDSVRLETRLKADAALRAVMEDLGSSRGLLRTLPQRRSPRNFTLTPKMAGIKPPEARTYPAFRLATVLAAFLFVASVALNGFAPVVSSHLTRQAVPAYGYGGGTGSGGGCDTCGSETPALEAPAAAPVAPAAPLATEAPLQAQAPRPFAATLPPETPLAAQDNASKLAPPTAEVVPQSLPPASANNAARATNEASRAPVPLGLEIGLAGLALVFGVAAGTVRMNSERKFRERFLNSTGSTRSGRHAKK